MTAIWVQRIADAKPERFITFTSVGADRLAIRTGLQHLVRDIRAGAATGGRIAPQRASSGTLIHRQLSKKFERHGNQSKFKLEYFGTVELHKSGVAHLHLLQKGDFIPNGYLEKISAKNGWGFTDIRAIGGETWRHRYVMKHLAHSHGRRWDGRLIRYSRGFFPPKSESLAASEDDELRAWSFYLGTAASYAEEFREMGLPVKLGAVGVDWNMGNVAPDAETGRLYDEDIMLEYCKKYERYVAWKKGRAKSAAK